MALRRSLEEQMQTFCVAAIAFQISDRGIKHTENLPRQVRKPLHGEVIGEVRG